ncbi:MAG TPA: DUF58 domain-containing protein [Herpetosiphonaceae bacterium]
MWWKTTFRRTRNRSAEANTQTALDEAFLRRLERLSINASRSLRGGLSGAHPSKRRLPAPTFSDHRTYSASDDLRYVDWNAYARQEHLFVKLGETEQDVPVHLLLDRSASMNYGSGDTNKLHYGRLMLAALGYLALANGDRLTATAFDTAPEQGFGPAQSKMHALSLLRYAEAITSGRESRIGPVLHSYTRPRSGGLIILISDLWSVGDIDQVLRSVQPPRWQLVIMHLLHRDELQPPLTGEIELEDSEYGDHLPISADAATLDRYHARLNQWCGAIETACQRRGASYTRISTDMTLERATIPYLRARQVLG